MVDGGDERRTYVAQQPVPERLVVVHDVELTAAGAQLTAGTQGESERFGKAAGPHRRDFERVDPVAVLATPRSAEGVGLAVQVEAGQLGEGGVRTGTGCPPLASVEHVQHRVRLGADDLDAVTEPGQFAGQMAYVDALSAAERVPL